MKSSSAEPAVALAVAAHPDDIEFMMAGTLLRLGQSGAETHIWNLSSGYCGSDTLGGFQTSAMRFEEASDSARIAGATIHQPITNDLEILYTRELLIRVTAVVREINPTIVLLPSPQDYMEDHMTASRLVVTGVFGRGMRNYLSSPPLEPVDRPVALYHAMPHGLRDQLRRLVRPGQFVDVTPVMDEKRAMLACHKSQKEWLDLTQGVDSYIHTMESMTRDVGTMSGIFTCAEGWRRHAHWGFGPEDFDPLSDILGDACYTDPDYEASLGSIN